MGRSGPFIGGTARSIQSLADTIQAPRPRRRTPLEQKFGPLDDGPVQKYDTRTPLDDEPTPLDALLVALDELSVVLYQLSGTLDGFFPPEEVVGVWNLERRVWKWNRACPPQRLRPSQRGEGLMLNRNQMPLK